MGQSAMRYLIDGYNLAHALGLVPARKTPHGAELARRSLLVRLRQAPGLDPSRTTVVFDAFRAPPGSPARQDSLGFEVHFAHRQSADDLIEDLLRREATPRQLTVVSDDRRLKDAAGRRGCVALGCLDFLEQIARPPPTRSARSAREPAQDGDKPEHLTPEELGEWQRCFGVDPDQADVEW